VTIIKDAIEERLDMKLYREVLEEEEEIKRWLPERLSQVNTEPPEPSRPAPRRRRPLIDDAE
jgi:hypothetical protein